MVFNTKGGLMAQSDAQFSFSILPFPFPNPKPGNVKAFRISVKLMLSEYIQFANKTVKRHVIMEACSKILQKNIVIIAKRHAYKVNYLNTMGSIKISLTLCTTHGPSSAHHSLGSNEAIINTYSAWPSNRPSFFGTVRSTLYRHAYMS